MDKRNNSQGTCVFLTGVTGFFGRYLLYQLCEANWVQNVYVLIRSKKEESPRDRLNSLLKDSLFVHAREQGVSFDNVQVVEGDCLQPRLGLSDDDLTLLSREVTLVLHNAAALSFAAKLKTSVRNNTTPTWNLYQMCCSSFDLQPCFVFISSLATNSHIDQIPERLIPFQLKAATLHNFITDLPPEKCEEIKEFLMENRLDSYGFSKALAENMIAEHIEFTGGIVPVSSVRPGGINACFGGPLKGWLHPTCFYGQLAYMAYRGKVPMFLGNRDIDINMAPCDLVGNLTMCACLDILERKKHLKNDICVINGSVCCIKGVSTGDLVDICQNRYVELFDMAVSVDNEIEYVTTGISSPWMIKNHCIFQLLFFIINAIVFLYLLFLSHSQKVSERTKKTVQYIKKYMEALGPYLLRPMVPLSDNCDVLLRKYEKTYSFNSNAIKKEEYLRVFMLGVAKHIIPKLDREAGNIKEI